MVPRDNMLIYLAGLAYQLDRKLKGAMDKPVTPAIEADVKKVIHWAERFAAKFHGTPFVAPSLQQCRDAVVALDMHWPFDGAPPPEEEKADVPPIPPAESGVSAIKSWWNPTEGSAKAEKKVKQLETDKLGILEYTPKWHADRIKSNAAELRKQLVDIPQDQLDYSRTWSHEKTLEAITTAAKNRELCARWLEAFVREVGMVSSAETVATMILEALVEYEGVIPVARFHDEIMAMRNERG
ncbi:unnamed protein product, partial [Symbiodinium sp. KB8]